MINSVRTRSFFGIYFAARLFMLNTFASAGSLGASRFFLARKLFVADSARKVFEARARPPITAPMHEYAFHCVHLLFNWNEIQIIIKSMRCQNRWFRGDATAIKRPMAVARQIHQRKVLMHRLEKVTRRQDNTPKEGHAVRKWSVKSEQCTHFQTY